MESRKQKSLSFRAHVGDILDSGLTSLSKDVRVWCRKQISSGNVTLYVVEFVN